MLETLVPFGIAPLRIQAQSHDHARLIDEMLFVLAPVTTPLVRFIFVHRRVWNDLQLICENLADLVSGVYKAAVFFQKRMARKVLIEIKNFLPERRQWNMLTVRTSPTTSENMVFPNRDISELINGSAAWTVS